jgi:hypothetical protein
VPRRDVEGLWEQVAECFEGDPGEMPEVHFSVDPNLASAMLTRLHSLADRVVPATYWDREVERDLPVSIRPDPAELVFEGRADGFVVWFEDLRYRGTTVPSLALVVRTYELAVFWDVRDEWNAELAVALLYLLDELRGLAADAKFVEAPHSGEALGQWFFDIVDSWTAGQDD